MLEKRLTTIVEINNTILEAMLWRGSFCEISSLLNSKGDLNVATHSGNVANYCC